MIEVQTEPYIFQPDRTLGQDAAPADPDVVARGMKCPFHHRAGSKIQRFTILQLNHPRPMQTRSEPMDFGIVRIGNMFL